MNILYFAWVRERVGHGSEIFETQAKTVSVLVDELCHLGEGHALAFADRSALRVAVDQELVDFDAPIGSAREVAFFPPMTGG